MAGKSGKAGSSNPEAIPKESGRIGDIVTAAKSTIDEGDYSRGYPRNTDALETDNKYPGRKKG